jgi:hypothetical protein
VPLPFAGPESSIRMRSITPKGRRRVILDFSGSLIAYVPPIVNRQQQERVWDFPHLQGRQVTVSEDHPLWARRKSLDGLQDVGGNFYTQKTYVEGSYTSPYVSTGSETYLYGITPWSTDWYNYKGCMAPVDPNVMEFPSFTSSSMDDLDEMGASAIAACKPTNSVADLSVALGEILAGGKPKLVGSSMWKDKTIKAKKAGDEYLNWEFGWEPIARDVSDVALAIMQGHEILAQYERDSGKVVRRRINLSPYESTESTVIRDGVNAYAFGPLHSLQAAPIRYQGKVFLTKETRVRRWFSGAFTYYLPPSGTVEGEYLRAKKLYGLGITPETMWNLTPWSWAVDWFSNAGDVLANISSIQQDSLVLRYAYIMEHSVVKHTYTFAGPTGYVGSAFPPAVSLVAETKLRKRATPYGFGLNWADFSARQLSILAALGLSKGR